METKREQRPLMQWLLPREHHALDALRTTEAADRAIGEALRTECTTAGVASILLKCGHGAYAAYSRAIC